MLDFLNYRIDLPALILCIVFGCFFVFQVLYYIIVFGRIIFFQRKKKPEASDSQLKGVSIVMVTSNNEAELREQLINVLEQDYPEFEVLVLDEHSSDDTKFVLHVLEQNYPNLKSVRLAENTNNFDSKKFSTAIGIRSAKYDTIVLLDISCKITSFSWLKELVTPVMLDNRKQIVTSYCNIESKKGFTNALVQYDNATHVTNMLGQAILGNPYTAEGRNMVYSKSIFGKNKGFIAQYSKKCRQEDYFVHRTANKRNTAVVINKDATATVAPYSSYSSFRRNKFARVLSHKALAADDKVLLALMPLFTFLMYALIAVLILIGFPWQYCAVSIVLKWLVEIIYYRLSMKKLCIKGAWWAVPFLEIYMLFMNFNLRIKALFFKKKRRKIKWEKA